MCCVLCPRVTPSPTPEDDGGGGSEVEVQSDPVAVLGEEVSLRCLYHGNATITASAWRRHRGARAHRLAGFTNSTAFRHRTPRVAFPPSPTNITVRMRVSGVDAEGEYICAFQSQDSREFTKTVFLRVHGRSDTSVDDENAAETQTGQSSRRHRLCSTFTLSIGH